MLFNIKSIDREQLHNETGYALEKATKKYWKTATTLPNPEDRKKAEKRLNQVQQQLQDHYNN
ncbi:MAG: hypothetical protein RAP03_08665 [Candidatus Electryonea clarkiae]|nr:hypothetical protein [Candidatus Electryonea clarkiae]